MLFRVQKRDPQVATAIGNPPCSKLPMVIILVLMGPILRYNRPKVLKVPSPGRYHFWTNPLHQQFVSAELLHSLGSAHCASCGTRCSKCTNGYNINTWAKWSKPTISLLGGAYQLVVNSRETPMYIIEKNMYIYIYVCIYIGIYICIIYIYICICIYICIIYIYVYIYMYMYIYMYIYIYVYIYVYIKCIRFVYVYMFMFIIYVYIYTWF